MTEVDPDEAFMQGRALFDGFVRGDAMIGLIADVPGTERAMLDALWMAAQAGVAPAYRTLAECYLAALRTLGAFDGIDPADADARPWSADARAIEDDCEVLIGRHGHGSGALRQAVRDHLPHLGHVARHRPGLPAEGGDAVTVVWVRG